MKQEKLAIQPEAWTTSRKNKPGPAFSAQRRTNSRKKKTTDSGPFFSDPVPIPTIKFYIMPPEPTARAYILQRKNRPRCISRTAHKLSRTTLPASDRLHIIPRNRSRPHHRQQLRPRKLPAPSAHAPITQELDRWNVPRGQCSRILRPAINSRAVFLHSPALISFLPVFPVRFSHLIQYPGKRYREKG